MKKEVNDYLLGLFTGNKELTEKDNPYVALEADATAMYLNDPKDHRAFLETFEVDSEAYKAVVRGKDNAIEIQKAQNHAYVAEKIYNEVYNPVYTMEISDPDASKAFGEIMKAKGGAYKAAYESAVRQSQIDRKRAIQKQQQKYKSKDKGKGIDMDD